MQCVSAFWLLIILFAALLAGCNASGTTPGRMRSDGGTLSFEQAGAAEVPGKASAKTTTAATIVPPGSVVTAHPDGSISWTTAEPLRVETTIAEETATGPQSFAPPAPPSPGDVADGRARWLAWIALGLGLAAGFFGTFKGWQVLGLGGWCVAGAAGFILILPAIPVWVWVLGGVGVAAAVGGPAYYRFVLRPRDTAGVSAPGPVTGAASQSAA